MKWISVKDELPIKNDQIYFCAYYYPNAYRDKAPIDYHSGCYKGNHEWYINDEQNHNYGRGYEGVTEGYENTHMGTISQNCIVTHWMKPEPPEDK